jgi:hypothetical protein
MGGGHPGTGLFSYHSFFLFYLPFFLFYLPFFLFYLLILLPLLSTHSSSSIHPFYLPFLFLLPHLSTPI